jgi:riboflavin synthase
MYTGIVQGVAPVVAIEERPGLRSLTVGVPERLLVGLASGASVALDGVCLTVTRIDGSKVSFDTMAETQQRTTLGSLAVGGEVNIERSARVGDEIGGHEVSGHVDGTAEIVRVEKPENNFILTLRLPARYMPYVFAKGFIAVNGASLTVVDVDRETATLTLHLIPETLRLTTFARKRPGDHVNFEADRRTQTIVDTVRAYLSEQPHLLRER